MNPLQRLISRLTPNFEPQPPKRVGANLRQVQAVAEKLLEEMVNIDSTTADVAGVNQIQEIVARELTNMGFEVRLHANPDPEQKSGLLVEALYSGTTGRFITFISHADTVLGLSSVGAFRKTADRAMGSGVIDNKGGLVVALCGLKLMLADLTNDFTAGNASLKYGLRFVCSPNEEGGSTGFHNLFRSFATDSMMALGFEPALDDGSIIESRRGNRWYNLTITGEEAHAGRCKGEQINAAHDLAIKISKLSKLTDLKLGVSVNVGHISGGRDRYNVVCGSATAKIDARFSSFETRDRLHEKIERILTTSEVSSPITGRASQSSFVIDDDCPPFSATSKSRALLAKYLKAVSQIENRVVLAKSAGGAGDVNHMSKPEVVVIDGLGPIGGNMHTVDEFVTLSSLSTRSQALAQFLEISLK